MYKNVIKHQMFVSPGVHCWSKLETPQVVTKDFYCSASVACVYTTPYILIILNEFTVKEEVAGGLCTPLYVYMYVCFEPQ